MVAISPAGATENLEYFHLGLREHFSSLYERRKGLTPAAPVFALEHGLSHADLQLLQDSVRAVHGTRRLYLQSLTSWLPHAIHAAEVAYNYDGIEYWPPYAATTPGWIDNDWERDRVRSWFVRFSREFGGAIPQGAWAQTFRKIAWPITHAVLPQYLQRQVVKMLADHRRKLGELLDDPHALGVRLHEWSRDYSDRLEKFCQNTELVGHVTVALLLSSEDHESPYIEPTTLRRVVDSLNSERMTARHLHEARHSAHVVRSTQFQPARGRSGSAQQDGSRDTLTDPRLHLARADDGWHAFANLPDFRVLQHTMPAVYDELRRCRAVVAGARQTIPTGGLLFALPPIELTSWPAPSEPFVQLQRGSTDVNVHIAENCRISPGPWWLFRYSSGTPALEVKGKFVRPGGSYCLVGEHDITPPDVAWCHPTDIAVDGLDAYELELPVAVRPDESAALIAVGLSLISDVTFGPVGVVPRYWDGEGTVEWLAGESPLVAIHAEHSPTRVRLLVDGDPHFVDWPTGQTELFLSLGDLAVGTHEILVSVGDPSGNGRSVDGTLIVIISDPLVRPEGTSAGEGIRLRTTPAQPSLPELWDGRATVELDGPSGTTAEFTITLRDGDGVKLGGCKKTVNLPLSSEQWRGHFRPLRESPDLAKHYDECDSADLAVSRAGIGFATLTCERGFTGLRWILKARHREGGYVARLIDRTDGEPVVAEFFSVERPLVAVSHDAKAEFVGPPRGGLLRASNGEQEAAQIIPPDPNQMLRIGIVQPVLSVPGKSLAEVHKLIRGHRSWHDAELPAHPFGMRERSRVLDAFTTAIASMLAPGHWANFERTIVGLPSSEVDLDKAESLIGESTAQRSAAKAISSTLWKWTTSPSLINGFRDAIAPLAASAGMPNTRKGAQVLLQLASCPGKLSDWDESELDQYLRCVLTDPVLMRAARFAILGVLDGVAGGIE